MEQIVLLLHIFLNKFTMKIDRFFQLFVIKEKKFYPLYIAQLENINNATDLLLAQYRSKDKESLKEYYKGVKALETKGDEITYKIYEELNKTFVTPFDREDIHILASRIDTFLDFIHDSSRKLVLYKPKEIFPEMITIAEFIKEDAMVLLDIMKNLEFIIKKSDYIVKQCYRIKDIEHKVDDLYENFIGNLFGNEKDAIELVKHKNIVQALEDTTDRAKDISDIIRSIIVKSA